MCSCTDLVVQAEYRNNSTWYIVCVMFSAYYYVQCIYMYHTRPVGLQECVIDVDLVVCTDGVYGTTLHGTLYV